MMSLPPFLQDLKDKLNSVLHPPQPTTITEENVTWLTVTQPNPYVVSASLWGVVVGFSLGLTEPAQITPIKCISVLDKEGNEVDSFDLPSFAPDGVGPFTKVIGIISATLPRRMLVPPGGTVKSPQSTAAITVIQVGKLSDAKGWL